MSDIAVHYNLNSNFSKFVVKFYKICDLGVHYQCCILIGLASSKPSSSKKQKVFFLFYYRPYIQLSTSGLDPICVPKRLHPRASLSATAQSRFGTESSVGPFSAPEVENEIERVI